MAIMGYVTIPLVSTFVNVSQGLLVITVPLVSNQSIYITMLLEIHWNYLDKINIIDSVSGFIPFISIEISPEVDHCAGDPCGRYGVCHNTTDGLICKCVSGYTGDNCTIGELI